MASVIYASISAFLICWLSLNVIKKRRKHKTGIGDGGNKELITAIAAQSNAIEYIPIALILLFALEYNQANNLIVHLFGISLIIGRFIHAKGIISETIKQRVVGMQITIYTIIGLATINFIYLPYEKLIKF